MRGLIVKGCILVLFMLLGGCRAESSTFDSSLVVPVNTSPLTTPTVPPEPSPLPLAYPTSQPGLATVTGVLLRYDKNELPGMDLYLGEMIETSDASQAFVGLDKAVAPKAVLDLATGAFAFHDVPPGKYALMVERPLMVPLLVDDPKKKITLSLEILADDNIDLGTLYVDIRN